MKFNVYEADRSESFVQPLVRRLKEEGRWEPDWHAADVFIVASDRREALRASLDVYEAGIPIWQWGGHDSCEGDKYHYDGTYRRLISELSTRIYVMRPIYFGDGRLWSTCLGPPHIDDLPDTEARPWPRPYALLMHNPLPWSGREATPPEDVPEPPPVKDMDSWAMWPGTDYGQRECVERLAAKGWKLLTRMKRAEWLRWVRHAEYVTGNSSALTFEAPLWHRDDAIRHVGLRNKGRGIVRWDVARWGSPTENMMALVREYTR